MIIGVAIRSEAVMVKLPKPNRHHHCFLLVKNLGINAVKAGIGVKAKDQGFYTHTGKYLDRQEALKYVKRIKQPTIDKVIHSLFSEDLW